MPTLYPAETLYPSGSLFTDDERISNSPTNLDLNPGTSIVALGEQATALVLSDPVMSLQLAMGITTLALYDHLTDTTIGPGTTTLLLDG